jgi:hypothetical protein
MEKLIEKAALLDDDAIELRELRRNFAIICRESSDVEKSSFGASLRAQFERFSLLSALERKQFTLSMKWWISTVRFSVSVETDSMSLRTLWSLVVSLVRSWCQGSEYTLLSVQALKFAHKLELFAAKHANVDEINELVALSLNLLSRDGAWATDFDDHLSLAAFRLCSTLILKTCVRKWRRSHASHHHEDEQEDEFGLLSDGEDEDEQESDAMMNSNASSNRRPAFNRIAMFDACSTVFDVAQRRKQSNADGKRASSKSGSRKRMSSNSDEKEKEPIDDNDKKDRLLQRCVPVACNFLSTWLDEGKHSDGAWHADVDSHCRAHFASLLRSLLALIELDADVFARWCDDPVAEANRDEDVMEMMNDMASLEVLLSLCRQATRWRNDNDGNVAVEAFGELETQLGDAARAGVEHPLRAHAALVAFQALSESEQLPQRFMPTLVPAVRALCTEALDANRVGANERSEAILRSAACGAALALDDNDGNNVFDADGLFVSVCRVAACVDELLPVRAKAMRALSSSLSQFVGPVPPDQAVSALVDVVTLALSDNVTLLDCGLRLTATLCALQWIGDSKQVAHIFERLLSLAEERATAIRDGQVDEADDVSYLMFAELLSSLHDALACGLLTDLSATAAGRFVRLVASVAAPSAHDEAFVDFECDAMAIVATSMCVLTDAMAAGTARPFSIADVLALARLLIEGGGSSADMRLESVDERLSAVLYFVRHADAALLTEHSINIVGFVAQLHEALEAELMSCARVQHFVAEMLAFGRLTDAEVESDALPLLFSLSSATAIDVAIAFAPASLFRSSWIADDWPESPLPTLLSQLHVKLLACQRLLQAPIIDTLGAERVQSIKGIARATVQAQQTRRQALEAQQDVDFDNSSDDDDLAHLQQALTDFLNNDDDNDAQEREAEEALLNDDHALGELAIDLALFQD